MEDVVKLNWLLVNKNVELYVLKLTHKSLYDETFPEYLNYLIYTRSVLIAYDARLRLSFLFRENQEHFSTRQQLFLIRSLYISY